MAEISFKYIESKGFEKVNNSCWRKGNCTLTSGSTDNGGDLVERIMSTRFAFKLCIDSKFVKMVSTEKEFDEFYNSCFSIE